MSTIKAFELRAVDRLRRGIGCQCGVSGCYVHTQEASVDQQLGRVLDGVQGVDGQHVRALDQRTAESRDVNPLVTVGAFRRLLRGRR